MPGGMIDEIRDFPSHDHTPEAAFEGVLNGASDVTNGKDMVRGHNDILSMVSIA